ncbi:hypothetical protein MRB53_010680 [Persea americana]|uniref:Uncharacterized protein n=1 Tax=Persea americana TaxID=3435 RepID=A0ACC2LSV1_PERAE|nr:hypothetical protein MRB53_010680 [Persea americana]
MGRGQKINAWTSKVGELKKEVKRMFITSKGSVEEMNMIDEIQRLGVAYHFEKEINDALEHIYDANVDYDDLKTVALRFRLLRQEGYICGHLITEDVFNKFKDGGSNFKEGLISDVEGLSSLYEAAFYGTHGEDTLDEAISFTRGRPASLMTHLDGPLAAQVGHALELPMSKRIPRLEARFYISLFQQQKQPNDALLELVKLDFNLVQSMHRIELKELTRIQRRRTELPLHVAEEGGSPPLPSCLDRRGREQIRGENSDFVFFLALAWNPFFYILKCGNAG